MLGAKICNWYPLHTSQNVNDIMLKTKYHDPQNLNNSQTLNEEVHDIIIHPFPHKWGLWFGLLADVMTWGLTIEDLGVTSNYEVYRCSSWRIWNCPIYMHVLYMILNLGMWTMIWEKQKLTAQMVTHMGKYASHLGPLSIK